MFIALKPESSVASADQVINRLRPKLAKIQGITLYMQAAQDITIGARCPRPNTSSLLPTPTRPS
jgi:Cation/multidrug efflux pump